MNLEEKLRSSNPADDKLAIYKTQAATASKKKETKAEECKNLETEKEALEKLMTEREGEYVLTKGTKYMKRDDFRDFAMKLREKNKKYKVMKKELEEIRSELIVLNRTEQVLTSRAGDIDDFMKNLERKKGVSGYTAVEAKMENVAKDKRNLDIAKDKNMEELTNLVTDIEAQLKEKKAKLAP
jgi:intraflagellar transport protein 81